MTRPRDTAPVAARPETDRRIGDIARVGVIDSVDLAAGKAVVRFGDAVSPPLDWAAPVGDVALWLAPTVGAQVLVVCPDSDIEQGVILNGLPAAHTPPPAAGEAVRLRFGDGAVITYDPGASVLTLDLPGEAVITAPGGITLAADLTIQGVVDVDGDVVADGISLKDHIHGSVAAGSAKSGKPE